MNYSEKNGHIDIEAFRKAVDITITAQEIIVGFASYPTKKIEINSYDYRPLGLGYANLGALLMSRGVAYDSDEGRALAAALTAIMTGEAYHQSSIVARDHGWTFSGYAKNRDSMLEVMRQHRAAVDEIDTIEGAPGLKEEHLTIFDCAFKPANGIRSIHYMGHVKMMAATQPFISGAISKTVNMPNEATVEEIMGTYVEAWRLGVKA